MWIWVIVVLVQIFLMTKFIKNAFISFLTISMSSLVMFKHLLFFLKCAPSFSWVLKILMHTGNRHVVRNMIDKYILFSVVSFLEIMICPFRFPFNVSLYLHCFWWGIKIKPMKKLDLRSKIVFCLLTLEH